MESIVKGQRGKAITRPASSARVTNLRKWAYLLLGNEKHHRGKELGLTSPDDGISSSLHVFGDVVGTGGHHSELLHNPDGTGRNVFTDIAHSGNSEHWISITALLILYGER
jgi:hypothetical protein